MTDPEIKALALAYMAANGAGVHAGGGVTARALAKYVGLSEEDMVQRLHDYEKDNKVVRFGREFHSGREEPEPVWRLK